MRDDISSVEGELDEHTALVARAEQLERELARARATIAQLQSLDVPGQPSREPPRASWARLERRVARPITDAALERFIAAAQERLSVVGSVRVDGGVVTWRSAAEDTPIEIRLVRDPQGATMSLHVHARALPFALASVMIPAVFGLRRRRLARALAALEALSSSLAQDLEAASCEEPSRGVSR